MNMNFQKRKLRFSDLAELHIRDLFTGTPAAPKRLQAKKKKQKPKFVPPPRPIKPPMHFKSIGCPCCKRPVGVPDLGVIIDHYDVPPLEQAILEAVWRGRGLPVPTERIFDRMYADDVDGGPEPTRMYAAFKVALCHLRQRIEGSGVLIENCGYRRGYRLVLKEK